MRKVIVIRDGKQTTIHLGSLTHCRQALPALQARILRDNPAYYPSGGANKSIVFRTLDGQHNPFTAMII